MEVVSYVHHYVALEVKRVKNPRSLNPKD